MVESTMHCGSFAFASLTALEVVSHSFIVSVCFH